MRSQYTTLHLFSTHDTEVNLHLPWRLMGEWRYSSIVLDLGTRWRWLTGTGTVLYCDEFEQSIARQRLNKHVILHVPLNNTVKVLSIWSLLGSSQRANGLVRERSRETPKQMCTQQWSSCVFCAWSLPRGYKNQRRSVVSRRRLEVWESAVKGIIILQADFTCAVVQ
jgi:hypothetical protein